MSNLTSPAGKGPHRDLSKEQFWRKTLIEQTGSGRDIRTFCRQRGLTEPSFYAWRRAIALRDGKNPNRRVASKSKPAPESDRPTFVELRPKSAPAPKADVPLEILAGNRRLLIRPGCDRSLLREVLSMLGE